MATKLNPEKCGEKLLRNSKLGNLMPTLATVTGYKALRKAREDVGENMDNQCMCLTVHTTYENKRSYPKQAYLWLLSGAVSEGFAGNFFDA
jgi:hypothetical protein